MKQPLVRQGRYSYAVELNGNQRQWVIDELTRRKRAKGRTGAITEPEIRNYLQALVDKTLPIMLGEKK